MRRKLLTLLLIVLALNSIGCPPTRDTPSPAPIEPPDTDLCGKMCQHLGPKAKGGLGCEEGEPVYDSDHPGPKDVPNVSCEAFCRTSQERGAFLNPRCLSLVKSCAEIEAARKKKPETCVSPAAP